MKWKYTTIQYAILDKFDLSFADYAIADLIRHLQVFPYSKTGWCLHSVPQIAKALRLSDSTVKRSLSDLKKKGILDSDEVLPQARRITETFIYACDLKRSNEAPPPVQNDPIPHEPTPVKMTPPPVQNDPIPHEKQGTDPGQNDPVIITVGYSNDFKEINNNPEVEKTALPGVVDVPEFVQKDRLAVATDERTKDQKETYLTEQVEAMRYDVLKARIFADTLRKGTGVSEEYYKTLVNGFFDERLADIDAGIDFAVSGLKHHFKNWFKVQANLGNQSTYWPKEVSSNNPAPANEYTRAIQQQALAEHLARLDSYAQTNPLLNHE